MGVYSNAHRGKQADRESTPHSDASPGRATSQPEGDWIKARRKSWARLIQQVCEADPLLCECGSKFKVISVIEARTRSDVVGKFLKHINFVFEVLQLPAHPPPIPVGSPEPDSGSADFYYF